MTIRRVRWTASGEMLVREADDDAHAEDAVEAAVRRANAPANESGAWVEPDSFRYARESTSREPG